MTDIDLSTGTAPSPERTRQLAETLAELARVLCHQTRHHEALRYPADADRLVRELSAMAGRLRSCSPRPARGSRPSMPPAGSGPRTATTRAARMRRSLRPGYGWTWPGERRPC